MVPGRVIIENDDQLVSNMYMSRCLALVHVHEIYRSYRFFLSLRCCNIVSSSLCNRASLQQALSCERCGQVKVPKLRTTHRRIRGLSLKYYCAEGNL